MFDVNRGDSSGGGNSAGGKNNNNQLKAAAGAASATAVADKGLAAAMTVLTLVAAPLSRGWESPTKTRPTEKKQGLTSQHSKVTGPGHEKGIINHNIN
jgi:hypothetical protein